MLGNVIEQLRGVDLERAVGLRPAYPRLALELDRRAMTVVRLRPRRRGRLLLDAYRVEEAGEADVPATIFDQSTSGADGLGERLDKLFESAGVRPGKISLVLPDNLAKLTLLTLPERPPSRRQLEEVIRFKTRRGVPFRMADAALSYQLLPGDGPGISILVAVVRRALIERYERALEGMGARPGLVDLCTPNLLNLCRDRLAAAKDEGDLALLNCAATYFSLAIIRDGRLVFLRCKSYAVGDGRPASANGLLARELGYSMSYYQDKLSGEGIRRLFVRSAETPVEELRPQLAAIEAPDVEPIDPVAAIEPPEGAAIEPELAQRLAPAIGAALGRA